MGGIDDGHVEWAIINRLKAMLDDPPQTKFNVTQTFAIFSAVLLWTKNRGWVARNDVANANLVDAADKAAHAFRQLLGTEKISDKPWSLPLIEPSFAPILTSTTVVAKRINGGFENMPAEVFINWLRNAIGHGDGRTIRPLHKRGKNGVHTWLSGFEIKFNEVQKSKRILHLQIYDADMRRIGSLLADRFCQALANSPDYFMEDVATRVIETEAAA